jgi:SAM-dependent methyltransferase
MDRSGWSLHNTDGYCPRCNTKARHRRLWLYLRDEAGLFDDKLRVLDVGPAPGLARALHSCKNLDYVAIGTEENTPGLSVLGDVRALPFLDGTFDVVLCQHVLEHVDDDRRSLSEIRRVAKQGGWAVISVPLNLDGATHEDPSITDPAERERLFGEPGHVRIYGKDFAERLRDAGFETDFRHADEIPSDQCERHGLRRDEHLFICRPRRR